MSKKVKRNVSGLLEYTASLKSSTEERANRAIDELKRKKDQKINFRTVSAASGVSTTTLYNNPVLRTRIESLRSVKEVVPKKETEVKSMQTHEQELRQQIKKLKEEKEMLIAQLLDMERLLQENQRLKALLSPKKLE